MKTNVRKFRSKPGWREKLEMSLQVYPKEGRGIGIEIESKYDETGTEIVVSKSDARRIAVHLMRLAAETLKELKP